MSRRSALEAPAPPAAAAAALLWSAIAAYAAEAFGRADIKDESKQESAKEGEYKVTMSGAPIVTFWANTNV